MTRIFLEEDTLKCTVDSLISESVTWKMIKYIFYYDGDAWL